MCKVDVESWGQLADVGIDFKCKSLGGGAGCQAHQDKGLPLAVLGVRQLPVRLNTI